MVLLRQTISKIRWKDGIWIHAGKITLQFTAKED
jgi:hypothetical protein